MKKSKTLVSITFTIIAFMLLVGVNIEVTAAASSKQQIIVDKARITFETFMNNSNYSWLKKNLHQAKGLLIIPSVLKGGFIVGASGGTGLLLVRDKESGNWSQPGFYDVGSITLGLQIGGEAAEVIMMVRTQKALDKLYTSSFKFGGDTSVAAGPVGIGAKGTITNDIVSFAKSKGAYAGLTLEGAVIEAKDEWNAAYYGTSVTPSDIFIKRSVINPGSTELRLSVAREGR